MQNTLFDLEQQVVANHNGNAPNGVPGKSGAKNAVSRYSGLKQQLDQDKIYNGNWQEVDTAVIAKSSQDVCFMDLFSGAGNSTIC